MNDDRRESAPSISDEVEEAIDDKRAGVLAADATGMLHGEELITVAELREGEQLPPA
jgi:hypothetical protein